MIVTIVGVAVVSTAHPPHLVGVVQVAPNLGLIVSFIGFATAMLGILLALYGNEARRRRRLSHRHSTRKAYAKQASEGAVSTQIDPWLLHDGFVGGRMAMTTFLISRNQRTTTSG